MNVSVQAISPTCAGTAARMTLCVFTLALFLSAFIMFVLEPMAGKMLLPIVGGTPAGWIVAMAFFQIMLLAGYVIAHGLSALDPRLHTAAYIALLAAGFFFLPPHLNALPQNILPSPFAVFVLLCKTLAVPFIALAAGSSTLQRLFSTTRHHAAGDPYFLYAASNLGSFAGLLLYPVAIEPLAGLLRQSHHWTWLYAALITVSALCLSLARRPAAPVLTQTAHAPLAPVSAALKTRWVLLAFVPSSLMLGVTTHITTAVFSAPLIWVLPLALYLLTLVVAFSRRQILSLRNAQIAHYACALLALVLISLSSVELRFPFASLAVHAVLFAGVALSCHMQLTSLRPADNRRLTQFYLYVALGGALGGVLNAFIVPVVLDRPLEYPAMLAASLLLNTLLRDKPSLRAGVVGGALTLVVSCCIMPSNTLAIARNFFGVVKVLEFPFHIGGRTLPVRVIAHGTTVHGTQVQDPIYKNKAMAYYGPSSGLGLSFARYHPKNVLVIGLGAGELACAVRPGTALTFIEIDPAVISVAQKWFSFLKECGAKNPPSIVLGDGRLALERMKTRRFDAIVIDAFTGDNIPTHLLTLEAIVDYLGHLNPNGFIVINISNRFFDMTHPLAKTAAVLGLSIQVRVNNPRLDTGYVPSVWAVLTKNPAFFNPLNTDAAHRWRQPVVLPRARVWTDDYSSVLSALIALDPPPVTPKPHM